MFFYQTVQVGINVQDFLEIEKYEEPIPASMGGEVFFNGTKNVVMYDVEPIQKYNNLLIPNEEVVFETKIHGTNCRWIFSSDVFNDETFGTEKNIFIASKGQGDKGIFFKNNEKNANCVYVKPFIDNKIEELVKSSSLYKSNKDLTIFAEIYGSGIQDLTYGMNNGVYTYAVFDAYIGKPHIGRFLNYDELKEFCSEINLKMVDLLYRGPFSMEKVLEYTDGFDTIGNNPKQIREGIVIKPMNERMDITIGRVMVKSVSQIYKLRKNGTELN